MTRIAGFAVAPAAEEGFLTAWSAAPSGALYRALRSDVALRFVAFGSEREIPGFAPAFAAGYERIAGDGEVDGAGGVLLIAPFAVPGGDEVRGVAPWERARALLAPRQGYLGTGLHGAPDAPFVAVVRWSSPLMYARALQQPEIERAVAAVPSLSRPALYLRVDG